MNGNVQYLKSASLCQFHKKIFILTGKPKPWLWFRRVDDVEKHNEHDFKEVYKAEDSE